MIQVGFYICKCGRPKGSANERCREVNHAAANDRARHERIKEEAIRRIVERFGPASERVYRRA